MIKVNLLSPEKKEISGAGPEAGGFAEEEREAKINMGAVIGAAVVTLGVIGYLYITQTATLDDTMQRLDERRARKAELDNVLKEIASLERAKKKLDEKLRLIGNLKKQQQDSVRMMDELCDALPDWVWLSSLNFSNRKLTLQGRAMNNNLISDFIRNLKGTGYFEKIEFPNSKRRKQGGMEVFNFTLTCLFKDKAKPKTNKPKTDKTKSKKKRNKKGQ